MPPCPVPPPDPAAHWRRLRRLTLWLLVVWFTVTFVLGFFARELGFKFFGWPFSSWLTSQGALLVYMLIVAAYAWAAGRLDRACGLAEELPDEDPLPADADPPSGSLR